jgi:hypothetical protein
LLVMSAANQLCGIGELGEIHVAATSGAGYLDADLTEQQFVVNPHTGIRRTGFDRGIWAISAGWQRRVCRTAGRK